MKSIMTILMRLLLGALFCCGLPLLLCLLFGRSAVAEPRRRRNRDSSGPGSTGSGNQGSASGGSRDYIDIECEEEK